MYNPTAGPNPTTRQNTHVIRCWPALWSVSHRRKKKNAGPFLYSHSTGKIRSDDRYLRGHTSHNQIGFKFLYSQIFDQCNPLSKTTQNWCQVSKTFFFSQVPFRRIFLSHALKKKKSSFYNSVYYLYLLVVANILFFFDPLTGLT